jgi:hypothetical protein
MELGWEGATTTARGRPGKRLSSRCYGGSSRTPVEAPRCGCSWRTGRLRGSRGGSGVGEEVEVRDGDLEAKLERAEKSYEELERTRASLGSVLAEAIRRDRDL